MNSCNDALMQMSYKIGRDNFENYQQIFGFGQKTNIDLPGETRTDSLIYTGDNMTVVDLATNAFGQNFNTTMIQLATGFCSIVNGGKFYQPHVVKRITDENGNVVQEIQPTLLRETISESTSETLRQYMYSTVTSVPERQRKWTATQWAARRERHRKRDVTASTIWYRLLVCTGRRSAACDLLRGRRAECGGAVPQLFCTEYCA